MIELDKTLTDIQNLDLLIADIQDYSRRYRLILDFIIENVKSQDEYRTIVTQLYEPIRKENEKV